jgi:ribosomal-protein-alanine N-acetyltransferase
MRWDPPERIEDLDGPLERSRRAWRAGTDYNWTIEDRRTRKFLGRVSIRREQEQGEWSIGFWVHPNHQGNGYAKEAAAAMIALAFDRLGAERITAAHATWNHASGRVLLGIGMSFIRINPQGFMKHGCWVEEREYEIQRGRGGY